MQGNEFWLGMGYTLFWAAVLAAMGLPFGLLYLVTQKRRSRRSEEAVHGRTSDTVGGPRPVLDPDSWATVRMGQQAPAPQPRPATNLPPAPGPAPVHTLNLMGEPRPEPPPHPQRQTASERRHTFLAAAEGEGKTQSQIAFLVGDIANGDQVVWASTNLALHHSRDQQTDLRPIAHLFEHTRDPLEIMAVLLWASAEVNRRMPCYHQDEPHGDPIVIHVDELGGLYRAFGQVLVNAMRNIAEQGRKVDVFLFIVAHNALKESTGLDAALKPLFLTRLLGTVDQFTWTALVGPGVKLKSKPAAPGVWHQPDKQGNVVEVQIRRPTAQDIAHVALRRRMGFASILEAARPYRERLQAAIGELQSKSRGPQIPALTPEPGTEDAAVVMASARVAPGPWVPTELHLQVRQIIEDALPEVRRLVAGGMTLDKAREATRTSQRGIAKQLQLSAKGGSAAVNVGEAIKDWETYAGVRLFDVPQLPPQVPQTTRSERPERPEHLTPAA